MKRHLLQSISAICLLATLSLASCSRIEDNPGEEPGIQQPVVNEMTFTATLSPKSSATKSVDASGATAWVSGEEIAIYYATTNGHATATATVGTPNPDGSAPITATLSDAKNGTEVDFVYPAYLHNGEGDIDESKLLTQQNGLLTNGTKKSISRDFDAAKGTGTIIVHGSEASVSGTISLTNQVCICKFSFSLTGGGMIDNIEQLEIYIDGKTYSIVPSGYFSSKTVYVAMLPTSGADAMFGVYNQGNAMAGGGVILYGENYVKLASNVTLEAGKFYRNIPIECQSATEYSGNRTTTITIPDNGAIILNNATVSVSERNGITTDYGIDANGIIVLKGNNRVATTYTEFAGIKIRAQGGTLYIGGNGSLVASAGPPSLSGNRGAAIGVDYNMDGGYINIHGTIASLSVDGGIGGGTKGDIQGVIIDGVVNPTGESTYPHLTRSGDTWTHK